jgi:biotin operon repressor
MLYEQSFTIGQRLDKLVRLIRAGQHSAPALAEKLGVSIPTVSRDIMALRQRGYAIRSAKVARGWAYRLVSAPSRVARGLDEGRVSF